VLGNPYPNVPDPKESFWEKGGDWIRDVIEDLLGNIYGEKD
jgi:hypothetical protein